MKDVKFHFRTLSFCNIVPNPFEKSSLLYWFCAKLGHIPPMVQDKIKLELNFDEVHVPIPGGVMTMVAHGSPTLPLLVIVVHEHGGGT
jgi:hypothetical protein